MHAVPADSISIYDTENICDVHYNHFHEVFNFFLVLINSLWLAGIFFYAPQIDDIKNELLLLRENPDYIVHTYI